MGDDVYVRLGNRLNENEIQIPVIRETLDFLKEIFTEEQAELGAAFPLGAHTLKALAQMLSRDEAKLEQLLEGMADEGLIFISRSDEGEKKYSLPPYAPGILEFQTLKGEDNEKVRRRSRLINDMMKALDAMLEKAFKNPDASRKARVPGMRTVAIEELLPGETTTLAGWERMTELLDRETSFAVGACHCREHAKMDGHPCRLEGIPKDSCVYFGSAADFMVERNFAKRYSREALLDLLKACEKAGAVHNFNNFMGDNIVLCNCCGCCCGSFKRMKKYRGLKTVQGSNFTAMIDETACVGCGQCIEYCQIGALTMEGDVAHVNPDDCLGCGNCIIQCPTGCISLSRCAETKPPEKDPRIVGLGR